MSPNYSDTIPEEQLIDLILKKDKNGLAYLYDHYAAALYGVIFRIVGEEETAKEVLQDVFVKIWNKIASYDSGKGRLFTWMLNLARNQAIDCVRSKGYRQNSKNDRVESHLVFLDKKHFTTQEPDAIGVRDLLNSLNEDQQLIVTLLYFKGYTQSEVSKEYNIPLGTVKTRLRNAIYQLRKMLNIE